MQINSLMIEGVLPKDPEMKPNYLGLKVCSFSVMPMLGKSEFPVEVDGRLGDTCMEYLNQGHGVRVVGRLDMPDGKHIVILAEHVEFRPSK